MFVSYNVNVVRNATEFRTRKLELMFEILLLINSLIDIEALYHGLYFSLIFFISFMTNTIPRIIIK